MSWRSWAVDSRDGEVDSLLIDGNEVWSLAAHCPGDGWERGPSDFVSSMRLRILALHCLTVCRVAALAQPTPYGQSACFTEQTVEVPCASTVTLLFRSGIDQGEADESWAVSDVTVIGSTGTVVILREDGAAIGSWSSDTITDTGSAGRVHGPWGSDVTSVTNTVDIPSGISECEVSWRSWAIGSRDQEYDRVSIDGTEVWSNMGVCWLRDDGIGEGWELGPSDFDTHRSDSGACFDEVVVQVPCTDSMTLTFTSGVDQALSDESWAFNDVQIIGYYPETTEESCVAHLRGDPTAQNGIYAIVNGDQSYDAYCDMEAGGWELVMRVAASGSEFLFESEYWTNSEIFGDTSGARQQ